MTMSKFVTLRAVVAGALFACGAQARRAPRAVGLQAELEESTPSPGAPPGGASLAEAAAGAEFPKEWALPFVGAGAMRRQRAAQPQLPREPPLPTQADRVSMATGARHSGRPLWSFFHSDDFQPSGDDDGGSGEQPERSEEYDLPMVYQPALKKVLAYDRTGAKKSLALPEDWCSVIRDGLVEVAPMKNQVRVFHADLENDPDRKVAIKIAPSENAVLMKEVQMMERLKMLETLGVEDFGSIVAYYESSVFHNMRAVILEATDCSLDAVLQRFKVDAPSIFEKDKQDSPWWTPVVEQFDKFFSQFDKNAVMPLKVSVPIIIDVLRGALALEHAGLVHGGLTTSTVFLTEDQRAVIGDLNGACLEHCDLRDPNACGSPLEDLTMGPDSVETALFSPPEYAVGSASSPSAHVWGIGLIFARMCFGYDTTMLTVFVHQEKEAKFKDQQEKGGLFTYKRPIALEIVDIIHSYFEVEDDPSYMKQDKEVQSILSQMLARNPQDRITTKDALLRFEALAKNNGIKVPERRSHPRRPLRWAVPQHLEEEMERIGRIDEEATVIAPDGVLESIESPEQGGGHGLGHTSEEHAWE